MSVSVSTQGEGTTGEGRGAPWVNSSTSVEFAGEPDETHGAVREGESEGTVAAPAPGEENPTGDGAWKFRRSMQSLQKYRNLFSWIQTSSSSHERNKRGKQPEKPSQRRGVRRGSGQAAGTDHRHQARGCSKQVGTPVSRPRPDPRAPRVRTVAAGSRWDPYIQLDARQIPNAPKS